ncbi:MAG: hypothetical protein HY548_07045 [Elusimicrobia bacterium]|nr:hypothetical protein [Elusimicrobiota bacterium]
MKPTDFLSMLEKNEYNAMSNALHRTLRNSLERGILNRFEKLLESAQTETEVKAITRMREDFQSHLGLDADIRSASGGTVAKALERDVLGIQASFKEVLSKEYRSLGLENKRLAKVWLAETRELKLRETLSAEDMARGKGLARKYSEVGFEDVVEIISGTYTRGDLNRMLTQGAGVSDAVVANAIGAVEKTAGQRLTVEQRAELRTTLEKHDSTSVHGPMRDTARAIKTVLVGMPASDDNDKLIKALDEVLTFNVDGVSDKQIIAFFHQLGSSLASDEQRDVMATVLTPALNWSGLASAYGHYQILSSKNPELSEKTSYQAVANDEMFSQVLQYSQAGPGRTLAVAAAYTKELIRLRPLGKVTATLSQNPVMAGDASLFGRYRSDVSRSDNKMVWKLMAGKQKKALTPEMLTRLSERLAPGETSVAFAIAMTTNKGMTVREWENRSATFENDMDKIGRKDPGMVARIRKQVSVATLTSDDFPSTVSGRYKEYMSGMEYSQPQKGVTKGLNAAISIASASTITHVPVTLMALAAKFAIVASPATWLATNLMFLAGPIGWAILGLLVAGILISLFASKAPSAEDEKNQVKTITTSLTSLGIISSIIGLPVTLFAGVLTVLANSPKLMDKPYLRFLKRNVDVGLAIDSLDPNSMYVQMKLIADTDGKMERLIAVRERNQELVDELYPDMAKQSAKFNAMGDTVSTEQKNTMTYEEFIAFELTPVQPAGLKEELGARGGDIPMSRLLELYNQEEDREMALLEMEKVFGAPSGVIRDAIERLMKVGARIDLTLSAAESIKLLKEAKNIDARLKKLSGIKLQRNQKLSLAQFVDPKFLSASTNLQSLIANGGIKDIGDLEKEQDGPSFETKVLPEVLEEEKQETSAVGSIVGKKWGAHLWFAPWAELLFQAPVMVSMILGLSPIITMLLALVLPVLFAFAHVGRTRHEKVWIGLVGVGFMLALLSPLLMVPLDWDALKMGAGLATFAHFVYNYAAAKGWVRIPNVFKGGMKEAPVATIPVETLLNRSLASLAKIRQSLTPRTTSEYVDSLFKWTRDRSKVDNLVKSISGKVEDLMDVSLDVNGTMQMKNIKERGIVLDQLGKPLNAQKYNEDHIASISDRWSAVSEDVFQGVPAHVHVYDPKQPAPVPSLVDVLVDVEGNGQNRGILLSIDPQKQIHATVYELVPSNADNAANVVRTYSFSSLPGSQVVEKSIPMPDFLREAIARGETQPKKFNDILIETPPMVWAVLANLYEDEQNFQSVLTKMGLTPEDVFRAEEQIRASIGRELTGSDKIIEYVHEAVAFYLERDPALRAPDYIGDVKDLSELKSILVKNRANDVLKALQINKEKEFETLANEKSEEIRRGVSPFNAAISGMLERTLTDRGLLAVDAELATDVRSLQAGGFEGLDRNRQVRVMNYIAQGVLSPMYAGYLEMDPSELEGLEIGVQIVDSIPGGLTLGRRMQLKHSKSAIWAREIGYKDGSRKSAFQIYLTPSDMPAGQSLSDMTTALAHELAHAFMFKKYGIPLSQKGLDETDRAEVEAKVSILMREAVLPTTLSLLAIYDEGQFLNYIMREKAFGLWYVRQLAQYVFDRAGELKEPGSRTAMLKWLLTSQRPTLLGMAVQAGVRARHGFAAQDVKELGMPLILLVNAKALVDEKGNIKEEVLMLLDDKVGADSKKLIHLGVVDKARIEERLKEVFQDAARYPNLAAALKGGRIFFADTSNYMRAFIQLDGKINVQQLLYILMDEFGILDKKAVSVSIITNNADLWNNEVKIHDKIIKIVVTLLEGVPLADVLNKALNPPLAIIDVQA